MTCIFSLQVVYVTATMPYVMLLVFLVKGLLLDGSMDGIRYYINPKWDRLLDPVVCKSNLEIRVPQGSLAAFPS